MFPGLSDGMCKFMLVWAVIGAVLTFIGLPLAAIYGIWWAIHHVRIVP